MTFTKLGVVLPLGASGEFDDTFCYYPAPLLRDGRTWLYHSGYDGAKVRIGLAIVIRDTNFTEKL